jgi:NodT family efflux transporter outer membrane factor (OMF) lipoprotein
MNQQHSIRSGLVIACLLGLSGVLVGCALPGRSAAPLATLKAADAGLTEQASAVVSDHWWHSWGDPQLNRLVERTLQGSPSMAEAQARVRRMQALSGVVNAASLPQATLGAEFSRQRYSANGLFPPPIAGNTWSNDTLQASVGWNPDLWGQHKAELASAIGQVRAAQADAAMAANALVHQVVRGHVALARLLAQRDIAERTVQQRQQMQQLVQQRREAGLDTRIEQAQSDSTLADAAAQAEALKEQIALARHQLAALSGQAPQALDDWSPRLDAFKLEAMPATVGADLLGRRPDVVAARWRAEATQQDIQVARTQFYPNVNLSAFAGFNALGMNHLLDSGSRQYGVVPAIRLPLFDSGRLRAQLSGREAERDSAVANYNNAVLGAAKEAADAIGSSRSVERQWAEQRQALASAEHAHALAQQRFEAGLGNRLAVLSTESAVLAQRRLAIDLQTRQLENRANLMRALGGGWQGDVAQASNTTASAR